MHRLFVAIRPPAHVVGQLIARMGGIGGARWQNEDQLHLTLRFIGSVDRHQAADIQAELRTVRQRGFDLAIAELGFFERRGRPEVVWAGVAPHEPLKALHKKVDQAIIRIGLEPERRAYSPHITLARLGRSSGSIGAFLEQPGFGGGTFAVDSFCLFESCLTPGGALYSVAERYPLD